MVRPLPVNLDGWGQRSEDRYRLFVGKQYVKLHNLV